jgi:DNA-binding NtrC family response regulator
MVAILNFLTFSDTDASRQVKGCLEGLGYSVQTFERLNWHVDDLLSDQSTVALFGPAPINKDLMSRLAHRLDVENLLAVFAGNADIEQSLLGLSAELAFWPCCNEELRHRLIRIEQRRRGKVVHQETANLERFCSLNLVGNSAAFQLVLRRVQRIANCDASVLLQGETGTGKELIARAIHYLGARQDAAFVPVNCGAIPPALFESEFFGHARGAFTDARQEHTGLVELANQGTLFLDEIDSLGPQGQVSLLRFLQNLEYRPVGGKHFRQADVRIVAAGNRPLKTLVMQGEFREDLFYRLNLFTIDLPSLRHRDDDSVTLAYYFLDRFISRYHLDETLLSQNALAWLRSYHWPGNVRELENAMHRACLLAQGRIITVSDLMEDVVETQAVDTDGQTVTESFAEAKQHAVERFERHYLECLMRKAQGNVTLAARFAGKERRALGKLLKKHGFCRENYIQ